ncbi:VWA domain-containing protein [Halobaculum sp. MBLA0147]|uniref:vWA domain-containing protein n=1 Tax=Halobaculum sp. MBLA0147 TaxID=3079934 RepID=UPI003523EEE8
MTDTNGLGRLSRRKVLAGVGAVGLASAGAGLGTSAFFSDEEEFRGNQVTAGELDLKLDYKSTYSGGEGRLAQIKAMGYPEAEDLGDGTYLLGQAPSPADMQDWADLVQAEGDQAFDFCSPAADEFLVNGDEVPIFTLSDVKPGDTGEVTISLHLCDNPGYVELFGAITGEGDNGQNDPEIDAEGIDTDDVSELPDEIQVCVWYDEDCDNVFEPTGTGERNELEVALVSDTSGSMRQEINDLIAAATDFVDNLSSPDEAAAVSFSSGASLDQELTTDYQAVKDAIDDYTAGGTTNMTAGIDTAEAELLGGTNATAGASKVMIVLSDGSPNSSSSAAAAAADARNAGIRIFTIALGAGAAAGFLETQIASSPDDAFVAPDPADLDTVYGEIAEVVLAGEQKIAEGTMREVFEELSERISLDGSRVESGVQPYPGNTTQCIGFEWELPFTSGNETQSDSVSFEIGATAVQARNTTPPSA